MAPHRPRHPAGLKPRAEARPGTQRNRPVVLLDTNLLLLPFSRPFNLTEQLALAYPEGQARVPTCVLAELERMDHPQAEAALQLAATFPDHETAEGPVDEVLALLAPKLHGLIATNDSALVRRLREAGLPVLRLRSHNRLVKEGAKPD